jgi:hypothetical protein
VEALFLIGLPALRSGFAALQFIGSLAECIRRTVATGLEVQPRHMMAAVIVATLVLHVLSGPTTEGHSRPSSFVSGPPVCPSLQ